MKVRISRFGVVLGLILLALVACLLYLVMYSGQQSGWQIGAGNRIFDSSAGGDGTLYLISSKYMNGNDPDPSINAVSKDGSLKWQRPLKEIYPAAADRPDKCDVKILATDEDSVYVQISDCYEIIYENGIGVGSRSKSFLAAISSSGEARWLYEMSGDTGLRFDASVQAKNHRVYIYHNFSEYVIDEYGCLAWNIDQIYGPPAVGPDGTVYVNKAVYQKSIYEVGVYYWTCSDTYEAYDREGKTLWQRNLTGYPVRPFQTLPVIHEDLLYVPLDNGVLTIDYDGDIQWVWQSKDEDDLSPYWDMPFDSEGNIYLHTFAAPTTVYKPYNTYDFYVISRNGKLVRSYTDDENKKVLARDGKMVYYTPDIDPDSAKAVIPRTVNSLSNLETVTIRAYDPSTKEDIWSVRLPVTNVTTVAVTPENVRQMFPYRIVFDIEEMNLNNHNYANKFTWYHDVFNKTPASILSLKEASALTSGDILYVNLYTYSYETPTEYNKSRCAYASTLYAISRNGTLLWQKPVDRNIYWMAAGNNSTIYYSTTDGRVFTQAMYVAGGLTVAAILYTLAHFFGAGTVARARDRLNTNENRNQVLKYIADNPGSTMRDISRGLRINLGTIRYHMLILSLNHKTASYQADGKHLRYFINSNAYSEEEQRLIASLRREGIRKVLESLLVEPNQSNKELAATLGMQESAISRYTAELIAAGLVEKTKAPNGSLTYSISSGRRDSILSALVCLADRVRPPGTP